MDGFKHPNQAPRSDGHGAPRFIQPVRPPASIAPRMDDVRRPVQQMANSQMRPEMIRRDMRPPQPRQPQAQLTQSATPVDEKVINTVPPLKPKRNRRWLVMLIVLLLLILSVVGGYVWYQSQLTPVNPSDTTKHNVVITEGLSFDQVTVRLEQQGVIKNRMATELYARLSNKRSVKAGTCVVTKAQSTAQILDKLNAGCHDFIAITLFPGGTIASSAYKASQSTDKIDKTSARYILEKAGYQDGDITKALTTNYTTAYPVLFEGKPAASSLEGYLFGETYYLGKDATAKEVVQTALRQMQDVVISNDLVAKFKAQGLTLYQGITLASIVERELGCEDKPTEERKNRCYTYQQEIAQVFLKRLRTNMQLGSDVTFIYAADLQNVTPSVSIDSPYNTRKNTGLPPGPIATPGELALKAVASPAATDYLYFIAGDDGLIYFAHTDSEHQANIKNHCKELCDML